MTTEISIGDIARDTVTGCEGTVVGRTRLINNCDRVILQPKGTKDGKPYESRSFDVPNVEFVRTGDIVPASIDRGDRENDRVQLGDEVECRLRGVTGKVMALTEWLAGCSTMSVQPRELKDGIPVDQQHCDERDVTILKRANPVKPVKTGAPSRPEAKRSCT